MEALTGLEPARMGLKTPVLASLHSMLYLVLRRALLFLAIALPLADRATPVTDFRLAVALPLLLLVTERRLCGMRFPAIWCVNQVSLGSYFDA